MPIFLVRNRSLKKTHAAWQDCLKTPARSKRKAFEVTKIGIGGTPSHGSNTEVG